jgi:S-DNA-T family DNA segregation ATPase FtsK/SpoIIIE
MSVRTKVPTSGRAVVKKPPAPSHHRSDIAGILFIAFAAIVLVSLATSNAGMIGGLAKQIFASLVGKGAWLIPVLLTITGVSLLRQKNLVLRHLIFGFCLIFFSALGLLARPVGTDYFDPRAVADSGGYVGALIAFLLAKLLGASKSIALSATALVGLVLCVDIPAKQLIATFRDKLPSLPKRDKDLEVVTTKPEKDQVRLLGIEKQLEELPEPVLPKEKPVEPPKSRPAVKVRTSDAAPESGLDTTTPVPKEGYQLPPINLLSEALLQPKRSPVEMQKNIEILETTLEEFGISANVVEVANGPSVTRYEIQLGPGIRVNRITALADNIAMSLAASQVRVEAPIPGKAAIGVEVPNSSPSTVTLRELCDDTVFRSNPSRLFIALGKDVSGATKYADLTKMPHLLIGGATNSGKSIGLATLITSLLMRNTPKDVRLVMIDPKRVELTLFDHIPHLMCPVIKDVKEAAGVLRAVWREMDRRYDLFSNDGVRNIDGWNAKATFQDRLPYIVVVIDELADLMIQCGAEVETVIVRLAQLARAVGIHMVIATQRPSVDVITGLIKANIPSRIAFSVASHIDSRTIIDSKGAENLIGRGDMLFKPIEAIKPLRVQGCYVSEREIAAVCKFWREQQSPEYVLNPVDDSVADPAKEAGDFGEDETDPLWQDAVRWAVDRGQASTSMLQRKFSIGFQRASRLLDMMEERSIVGPRDGPRPREVLVNPLEVDELFAPRRINRETEDE